MSKPTVFFSHSSRDKAVLSRLKKTFCEKTGGAIDVFLSSDGQSIPLGKNWVYKVQEGLEAAALMLVFVSPNSVNSNWVYFEAGYSYSKGIRVIPIGFLGVDLTKIGPPLSLLQGFNVTSSDTLNNLIAVVNEQFGHNHGLAFSDEDYSTIIGSEAENNVGPLRDLVEYLEELRICVSLKKDGSDALAEIKGLLDRAKIAYQSEENSVRLHGVSMWVTTDKPELTILADPVALSATFSIIIDIIREIHANGVKDVGFTFEIVPGFNVVEQDYKITSRLYDSDIKLRANRGLSYRDMVFDTGQYYGHFGGSSQPGNSYVKIIPTKDKFRLEDAAELLGLLFAKKVIYQPEIY